MMTYRFDLKQSPLHGVGLFANTPLRKGQIIGRMEMVEVGKLSDFPTLPTVGVVVGEKVLCPRDGFPLWAVNWSEDPNIAVQVSMVFAKKAIAVGEELTINYYKEPDV